MVTVLPHGSETTATHLTETDAQIASRLRPRHDWLGTKGRVGNSTDHIRGNGERQRETRHWR